MTTATGLDFDLTKKVEAFDFVLTKKGLTTAPVMRVCAALDVSGSMEDEIRDGSLQKAMDQLGAVGIKFDDNGQIDVWTFDTGSYYVGTWTPDDYKTYIRNNNIQPLGGTYYSPFIRDIDNKMYVTGAGGTTVTKKVGGFLGFGAKKIVEHQGGTEASNDPVLVMIITDGEPNDSYALISSAISAAASRPTFFTFVGVSNQGSTFPTLERLNRDHDNVGVAYLKGFKLSDEQVYEQIVTDKLITFLNRF